MLWPYMVIHQPLHQNAVKPQKIDNDKTVKWHVFGVTFPRTTVQLAHQGPVLIFTVLLCQNVFCYSLKAKLLVAWDSLPTVCWQVGCRPFAILCRTLYLCTSSQKSTSFSRKSPFGETKCWKCKQEAGSRRSRRKRRISLEELIHKSGVCREAFAVFKDAVEVSPRGQ